MTSQRLLENLVGLHARDPELEARLRLPVSSEHVRVPDDGTSPRLQVGREWVRLEVDRRQVRVPKRQERLFVFGVGLGELVDAALRANRKGTVVAWERDPWLLRLALERNAWRRELRQGRLVLVLGADLVDHLQFEGAVVHHPVLAHRYRTESLLFEEGLRERRALVVHGELFVDDLADALRAEGWSVYTWDVARQAPEELAHTVQRLRPELAASINLVHGLTEACRTHRLPLITWEIDPATDSLRPQGDTAHAHVHTWRRRMVDVHRQAGFAHVEWLPLATNPARRRPELSEDPRYDAPVVFVGASMVRQVEPFRERFKAALCAASGGADAEAQAVMEHILTQQRATPMEYRVPALLAALLPGWREREVAAGRPDPAAWVAEIAAAERRLSLLAPLGRLGLRAWGDEGWRLLEPHGVRYMGFAGHTHELNRIYTQGRVHVDIGRVYQLDIVTMRVFDVLACGGFVLAEASEDLAELLRPGVEVETWSTPEELVDKVRWYLAHPLEAEAIARKGRERVLGEHTVAQRARAMLAEVRRV